MCFQLAFPLDGKNPIQHRKALLKLPRNTVLKLIEANRFCTTVPVQGGIAHKIYKKPPKIIIAIRLHISPLLFLGITRVDDPSTHMAKTQTPTPQSMRSLGEVMLLQTRTPIQEAVGGNHGTNKCHLYHKVPSKPPSPMLRRTWAPWCDDGCIQCPTLA
jgi:hypothetical protein